MLLTSATTRAVTERSSVKIDEMYGVVIEQLPHGFIQPEVVLARAIP